MMIFTITCVIAYAKPPQLAVEQFFDGRYNKEKNVTISIKSNDDGDYYRGMSVANNPDIIKKIVEAMDKDSAKASKSFNQSGEGGQYTSLKIINNGETIDIGLQQYNGNAYLFIKGKEKAFK